MDGGMFGGMATLDWAAIAIYFALLIGVATWVVRKNKNTADDYLFAGRNLGWWVVGASIFASNIGSEHCRSAAACPWSHRPDRGIPA